MNNVLTVIGTRPEAIKLFSVIAVFKNNEYFKNKVCVTGQHTSLLDNLLLDMNIEIDYKIASRENGSCLNKSAAHILLQLNDILIDSKPDLIIVQGDTTSAFIAALAGFYLQIPIAHIEAGLRTNDIYSPWPEEVHRCFIDKISNYFFTPTKQAEINLIKEGVNPNSIWTVGNTSIDSVRIIKDRLYNGNFEVLPSSRFILVTVHRRENHGRALEEICSALRAIAEQFVDIKIIFCLHPNPYVGEHVKKSLATVKNVSLISPPDHIQFIKLLYECLFVITDSGGIQEEVTFIGKPVLIVRNTTERPEIIEAGTGILVGTSSVSIIEHCSKLIKNSDLIIAMSKVHFPYGDGYAAEKIVDILEQEFMNRVR